MGKSTIVNSLLGTESAEAGPLAGLTTRPQSFEWNTEAGTALLWDTPDFDSLASASYRDSALEVLGAADLLVLVLSPEKYADLSVWKLLRSIEPLRRPLLVCLNKVTEEAESALRESLRHYLGEVFADFADGDLVGVLRWEPSDVWLDVAASGRIEALRARVIERLFGVADPGRRRSGVQGFLQSCWPEWVQPVVAEHAAHDEWDQRVRAVLVEAARGYEREFLEHPRRYDIFRRATAELLSLLEVPGLAGTVGRVRGAVTYPARRLLEAGRLLWRGAGSAEDSPVHGEGSEQTVLFDLVDRILSTLARDAARKEAAAGLGMTVWRALGRRLMENEDVMRIEFREVARVSCDAFEPEIEATADRLFERLKERPAVLNALRTMRASTDLAGLAFAVHSGGAPLDDLLFAPAMFAVTSMLTEGALGTYMTGIAADLKLKRKKAVADDLFEGALVSRLQALTEKLDDDGLFAIEVEALQEAHRAMDALAVGEGV